jgi:ATP-dependent DNA helicase RecQ
VGQFTGEPAELVRGIFANAKKGTSKGAVCYRLNPDDVASSLKQERKRVVRALEVLEQRQLVELTLSEVRQRYRRLQEEPGRRQDIEFLVSDLAERFARREQQTIAGIERMVELVTIGECQTNALAAYFGERREKPCGHCTFCVSGRAAAWAKAPERRPLPVGIDIKALNALRKENPKALRDARQTARFLCGLSSPATTRGRLTRNALYGSCEDRRFHEVIAWCEGLEN